MTVKYYYNTHIADVPCATFLTHCTGTPTSQTKENIDVYCWSDGPRPAVKPNILLPTTMQWRMVNISGNLKHRTDECINPGSVLFTRGTMRYAAASFISTRTGLTLSKANSAYTRAASKHVTKYSSVAETVFELRQTANMVAKSANRISSALDFLRHGRWKELDRLFGAGTPNSVKALKASQRVAGGWLELSFGWLPLVQTAYDAVDAYQNRVQRGKWSKTSYGFGKFHTDPEARADNCWNNGGAYKCSVIGRVANPGLVTLNSMGFLNPGLIAWQSLPYSFVADWFSDITPAIAALTHGIGLDNKRKIVSYEQYTVIKPNKTSAFDEKYSQWDIISNRLVQSDTGNYTINWNPKSWGVWRMITSISLLSQKISIR